VRKFRELKFTKFFHVLDIDGDGFVTKKDHIEMGERVADYTGASEEQRAQIVQGYIMIWDTLYKDESAREELNEEGFVGKLVHADPKQLKKVVDVTFPMMFKSINKDGDQFIQFDEFKAHQQLLNPNHDHNVIIRQSFDVIDVNGDGVISYDEYYAAVMEYFLSGDPQSKTRNMLGPLEG